MVDVATRLSGRTFVLAPNDDHITAITFYVRTEGDELILQTEQGVQRLVCGGKRWTRGTVALEQGAGEGARPIAASGAWCDGRTYVAQVWWYETPFGQTLTCRFDGDRGEITQRVNASFGSTERPSLPGQIV